MKTKKFLVLALLTILVMVVSACAPAAGVPGAAPAPAAGEEAAAMGAEEYTTPHPILSDLKVRTAIANCIDRDALIASVYPEGQDPDALRMGSWAPKTSCPLRRPYDFPD